MSGVQAVLFDKDGTLFDFRASWLPAFRGAAAELALAAGGGETLARTLLARAGWDQLEDRIDPRSPLVWGGNDDIAALFAAQAELAGIADVAARVLGHLRDRTRYPPVPTTDLAALFTRLRARGLRLGVATMDDHAGALASLAAEGVLDLVDFVTGADGGHGTKPEAGMALAFCRAVDLPPARVMVVGDSLADIAMARAAGCGRAVGVLTGVTPRAALAAVADHVLAGIAALEDVLAP